MVRPTSRILSAISFGVFCRSAPSTSAIMRSRKDEPGDDVMRTTIRSEMTVVPPVTAERSPPDSRMTGADSPVMAASLTEAMPSITSPSPGMRSPASHEHEIAGLADRRPGRLHRPRSCPASECAWRASRCGSCASVSACALPRPSATASAKLANSTVNHSQTAIWPENAMLCAPLHDDRGRARRWSAR